MNHRFDSKGGVLFRSFILLTQVTMSRSSVANGGFGDPDFTPKPLRISKREQTGTSTADTVNNSSLSIRKSQTHRNLQALAPSKRSSVRVNNTQLDLSQQDLATPTSQWDRRNIFLHVHKQRQSEPINTNTAAFTTTSEEPIGFSPFKFNPARSRDSCPTMSQSGSSSDAKKANTAARPACTRAFTTGTYRGVNPLSPVHEVSSSPSASLAVRGSQRRATTNTEVFYKNLDAMRSVSHRGLRKQRSFKNSLMSRMMSGLGKKPQFSPAALGVKPQVTPTALGFPLDFSPAAPSRAPKDLQRRSYSSTGTDTCSESDLHDALPAFPTPPTSTNTSSLRPKRFRELCTPADAVMMGAELTLTPEYDQLSSEEGRSMLVSLDIKCTTNSTSSVQEVWSQHTGLDVVVVIDNSLHTSPAALMASCETARFLASILNGITDRLAILCTSTTETSGTSSTVVRELSQIKMHRIKNALDAITSSTEKPKTNTWIDTIDCAKEFLLKSTVPDPDEEPLQDTFGHIFLLTPDADGLPFQSLAHENLTFHIISPAGAPRNDKPSIRCNGWKLRSLSGKETQAVSTKKDLNPTSVLNRLRVLIAQARSGKLLGNLTELVLEVSAGPDCIIEGVIGKIEFTKLHPGEVFTAIFRVKFCPTTALGYSLSRTPTQSLEVLPNTRDILSQLDKALGPTAAKLMTARLTYKHSLLPAGTTCSVTTECHIRRCLSDSDHTPHPPKPNSLQARDCTILVQKRLAYHLATYGSPRNGLTALRNEYGDGFRFSPCPDYVNLLAKELKYQARIVERLEIEASPKKPSTAYAPKSPYENIGRGYGAESYIPQYPVASDISTEERFKSKPALTALSVKESREQLRTDEARKIWGDLRKMKGPSDQIVKGRSASSPLEEARSKHIREMAIRNKRSIGSDTLRSLASAGESMGRGLGAPWM